MSPTGFTNSGFENPILGTGNSAFQYDPTGSAWSFSSTAGVAGNGSGITGGNPIAPEGSQVGFIQGTGSMSQVVDFASPGSYLISFIAAQRANHGTSNEAIQVLVDGTAVSTITPAGTNYSVFTTASFNVAAGSHTITLVGIDPSGDDYTALLDQARIYSVSPTDFNDPGFENPSLGTGNSTFQYDPTSSGWNFSGSAGVWRNGSGITNGNPGAPQGSQVAFIQATGSISQAVNFAAAGTYQISFNAAQRGNFGTSAEEVQVLVDGTVVGTFTPASTSYAIYTTAAFNVTAGSDAITFVGVDPTNSDYTALIDQAILLIG